MNQERQLRPDPKSRITPEQQKWLELFDKYRSPDTPEEEREAIRREALEFLAETKGREL